MFDDNIEVLIPKTSSYLFLKLCDSNSHSVLKRYSVEYYNIEFWVGIYSSIFAIIFLTSNLWFFRVKKVVKCTKEEVHSKSFKNPQAFTGWEIEGSTVKHH